MSDLSRITGRTRHLLLDFDGPICSVFAGTPAGAVADQLRDLLQTEGVTVPENAVGDQDPLGVLRHSTELGPEWVRRIEAALREAEVAAVRTATPTPQAREVMQACRRSSRPVAVVSNNSRAAVDAYLGAYGLAEYVDVIAARTEPDPGLMKPSPHLIAQAVRELEAELGESTLVGDSVTDIQDRKS